MQLVGIVAKTKDIQVIKKESKDENTEIIEITKESIKNIKNIKFKEIIFLQNIKLENQEYGYMNEILQNTQYLILNGDVEISILKEINLKSPIKLITFGFNSKSTITISSIKNGKMIVCIQRKIEKQNGEVLESQEKAIMIGNEKKIYNKLAVFIINELHN